MGDLARSLGATSAKMREACKVLSVPVPPTHYWASLKAGRHLPIPELPTHAGPSSFRLSVITRESLVDWVLKSRDATPLTAPLALAGPVAIRQAQPNVQSVPQARYMPLKDWGKSVFGDHAPHSNTLIRWCRDGRIQPQPRKIGRKWWVVPAAEYVSD